MLKSELRAKRNEADRLAGFTLIELLIATAILLVVSAVVLSLMFQMSMTQASVNNRTQMHSSIRSVTQVLQQEISQAGRIAVNANVTQTSAGYATLAANVGAGATSISVTNASTLFFAGELISISDNIDSAANNSGCPGLECTVGADEEVVDINGNPAGNNIPVNVVTYAHNAGATIRPVGAFYAGIIPTASCVLLQPDGTCTPSQPNFTNGSTGTVLKLFGDINDDGNMVYIEYTCSPNAGGTGTLTRSVSAWNAGSKAAAAVLLNNLKTNPIDASTGNPVPCFTFQEKSVLMGATTRWFVVNIAITLTGQTPFKDAQTNQFQSETKALLNVSPRNLFEIWQMASLCPSCTDKVQVVPPTVTALLP